jgi:ankyrin repeat protein
MLTSISEYNHYDALTLLRWIAYAKSPRTLRELAEATIIELLDETDEEGAVDAENRGGWADTLAVLAGLVTIQGEQDDPQNEHVVGDLQKPSDVFQNMTVRLAHFSVQEFLESARILATNVDIFHLSPTRDHGFLARSCLVYLHYYSNSIEKSKSKEDLDVFPLLEYASKTWFHHAKLQAQDKSNTLALSLLTSDGKLRDWLAIYQPDDNWRVPFSRNHRIFPHGLYYACFLGLAQIAKQLLVRGADINAKGGVYGNALTAASRSEHIDVVRLLIDEGADIDPQEYTYGNALQAASFFDSIDVVRLIIGEGADSSTQGSAYGNALQAASLNGNKEIIALLLDRGADVNARGGKWGTALQAASQAGDKDIVTLLLDRGANVNAQGGQHGNALQTASYNGHVDVVTVLLDNGADVNAQGGFYGNALQAASYGGHVRIVALLLDKGADRNAQGGYYKNALSAAFRKGHEDTAALLLERGAHNDDLWQDLLDALLNAAAVWPGRNIHFDDLRFD